MWAVECADRQTERMQARQKDLQMVGKTNRQTETNRQMTGSKDSSVYALDQTIKGLKFFS